MLGPKNTVVLSMDFQNDIVSGMVPVDADVLTRAARVLDAARAAGKPIFLSIGYATCHWCHVMERESFEDEATARFLNARFVPVKVDREERPDLDQVYMSAVQAMTGHGGWPHTA